MRQVSVCEKILLVFLSINITGTIVFAVDPKEWVPDSINKNTMKHEHPSCQLHASYNARTHEPSFGASLTFPKFKFNRGVGFKLACDQSPVALSYVSGSSRGNGTSLILNNSNPFVKDLGFLSQALQNERKGRAIKLADRLKNPPQQEIPFLSKGFSTNIPDFSSVPSKSPMDIAPRLDPLSGFPSCRTVIEDLPAHAKQFPAHRPLPFPIERYIPSGLGILNDNDYHLNSRAMNDYFTLFPENSNDKY